MRTPYKVSEHLLAFVTPRQVTPYEFPDHGCHLIYDVRVHAGWLHPNIHVVLGYRQEKNSVVNVRTTGFVKLLEVRKGILLQDSYNVGLQFQV